MRITSNTQLKENTIYYYVRIKKRDGFLTLDSMSPIKSFQIEKHKYERNKSFYIINNKDTVLNNTNCNVYDEIIYIDDSLPILKKQVGDFLHKYLNTKYFFYIYTSREELKNKIKELCNERLTILNYTLEKTEILKDRYTNLRDKIIEKLLREGKSTDCVSYRCKKENMEEDQVVYINTPINDRYMQYLHYYIRRCNDITEYTEIINTIETTKAVKTKKMYENYYIYSATLVDTGKPIRGTWDISYFFNDEDGANLSSYVNNLETLDKIKSSIVYLKGVLEIKLKKL